MPHAKPPAGESRPLWQYALAIALFVGAVAFVVLRFRGGDGESITTEQRAAIESEQRLKDEAAKANVVETPAPEMTPPPNSKPGRGPQ